MAFSYISRDYLLHGVFSSAFFSLLFRCFAASPDTHQQHKEIFSQRLVQGNAFAQVHLRPSAFDESITHKLIIITLPPISMEVENSCVWKVSTIGGTHFSLPWLWEEVLASLSFPRCESTSAASPQQDTQIRRTCRSTSCWVRWHQQGVTIPWHHHPSSWTDFQMSELVSIKTVKSQIEWGKLTLQNVYWQLVMTNSLHTTKWWWFHFWRASPKNLRCGWALRHYPPTFLFDPSSSSVPKSRRAWNHSKAGAPSASKDIRAPLVVFGGEARVFLSKKSFKGLHVLMSTRREKYCFF